MKRNKHITFCILEIFIICCVIVAVLFIPHMTDLNNSNSSHTDNTEESTVSQSSSVTDISIQTTSDLTSSTNETVTETETKKENTAFFSSEEIDFPRNGIKVYFDLVTVSANKDFIIDDRKTYFPVVKVSNIAELQELNNIIKEYYPIDTSKYDEKYFKEKCLFVIYTEDNMVKNTYQVEGVKIDAGKADFFVNDTNVKEIEQGVRFIFLTIEKEAVKNCTEFNAYTEYEF